MDEAKPPDDYRPGGAPCSPGTPAYGGAGTPGVPPVPGVPGACQPGVNVLPVPFPVMQAMPPMAPMAPMAPMYPAQPPPQAPFPEREVEAREKDRRQDSEWKHELLQKLWQLEANIARLADANQEICQAIRRSESDKLEAPDVRESPDIYEEEISKAVTALTSAAERLSINAELILDKEDQAPSDVTGI